MKNKFIATFEGFIVQAEKNGKYVDGFPCFRYTVQSNELNCTVTQEQYKPSVSAYHNEYMVPLEILQWVTLTYGNNDHSLFDDYTPEHLEYAKSANCEVINYLIDYAFEKMERRDYKVDQMFLGSYVILINDIQSPLLFIQVPD